MENCSDRADRISFPLDLTGGDEFAVIFYGKDFENREALMQTIREASMTHKKKKAGDIVASEIALWRTCSRERTRICMRTRKN